jgi:F-type H+-transporting ATPase subunit b
MDQLGLNLPTLVAQLINFLILLFLLRLFLWKPITGMLAERMKEQTQASERAIQEQIDAARQEGQQIIANSQQIANRVQEEGRAQAQTEAEAMLARARSEIQLERDNAIAELRKEFADITVQAAEKVIGQSLDKSSHQRLIDEVLADSNLQETKG